MRGAKSRVRLLLLMLVTLTSLVASMAYCAPVPKRPLFYPTSKGTKWVYEYGESECVEVITKSVAKDGGWYISIEKEDADKTTPKETIAVSEKGLLLTEDGSTFKYDPPTCILQLPHRKGLAWKEEVNGGTERKLVVNFQQDDEEITVPAGKYQAIRVTWEIIYDDEPAGRITYWYAQDVGVVKMTAGSLVKQLKSFSPGPAK